MKTIKSNTSDIKISNKTKNNKPKNKIKKVVKTKTINPTINSHINIKDDFSDNYKTLRKQYSRSLIQRNTYLPLSLDDKKEIMEKISIDSSNRLKTYNNLFGNIKEQIRDLNQTLTELDRKERKFYIELPYDDSIISENEKEYNVTPNIKDNTNSRNLIENLEELLKYKSESSDLSIEDEKGLLTDERDNNSKKYINIKTSTFKCFPKISLKIKCNKIKLKSLNINNLYTSEERIQTTVSNTKRPSLNDIEEDKIFKEYLEEENSLNCGCKCNCLIF